MGVIERYPANPILTRADIPEIPPSLVDVSSVFNPGAVKVGEETVLLLRVQNRGRETFTLVARSGDGVSFDVSPRPAVFEGIESVGERVYHCYDPRITCIEGVYHVMFAIDMEGHCELGLAQTTDFEQFAFMGIVSDHDNRNGVLFPEKVGGRYLRLDRPNKQSFSGGPRTGDTIVLSESEDLLDWRPAGAVASGRFHYWDEMIGPGPPPIKTRSGWLLIYHGVATHLSSTCIYQAGVLMLDLEDPGRVVARGRYNILEPRESYELAGQVPNVVFPSGAVVDPVDPDGCAPVDAIVSLYYGAADTTVCLARGRVGALIEAARA